MTTPAPATADVAVVGGGILGLACAAELLRRRPGCKVVLLEKEAEVAAHQRSHNSGVVHAGIYYAPGSLKARLCREGVGLLRAYCDAHGIPLREAGKLIVASSPADSTGSPTSRSREPQRRPGVRRLRPRRSPRSSRPRSASPRCTRRTRRSSTSRRSPARWRGDVDAPRARRWRPGTR